MNCAMLVFGAKGAIWIFQKINLQKLKHNLKKPSSKPPKPRKNLRIKWSSTTCTPKRRNVDGFGAESCRKKS